MTLPTAIKVRNPRTGREDYEFTPPTAAELGAKCAALRAAQPAWWAAGVEARCAAMARFGEAIDARRDHILLALAADTGRGAIAGGEIAAVLRNIRRLCARAPELTTAAAGFPSAQSPTLHIGQQLVPYPLVGVISPWNYPLALALIDAVPALLAGCAVLLKPSEVTPRFIAPLRTALAAVPELAAVFEVVCGAAATGAQLVEESDAVCFTGSVAVGRKVAVAAAQRLVPAFLELGGKDPAIVLPSADLERAADAILRVSVMGSGQACLAIERVYVHESQHDRLVDLLVSKSLGFRLNYPDVRVGEIGPIITAAQADIIDAHLDDAVARGAVIRCGGRSQSLGGGRYVPATVVTGVNHDMLLMREETFGPVTPVMAYRSVDEAVALANDSAFGLSGAVFAGTLEEARAVAERVNAGAMSLNDAGLVRDTYEAEKHAFGCSGLGGSRHGDAGLTRFWRRKAFIAQSGVPARLA